MANYHAIGWLLFLGGIAGGVYAWSIDPSQGISAFDPRYYPDFDATTNLGVLNDKTNLFIAAAASLVAGAVLMRPHTPPAATSPQIEPGK